jgi:hypothetical protein
MKNEKKRQESQKNLITRTLGSALKYNFKVSLARLRRLNGVGFVPKPLPKSTWMCLGNKPLKM